MFPFDKQIKSISAAELQQALASGKRYRLVDVREPQEYAEGHIPGSTLHPVGQIDAWASELNRDEEIVLVCRSGRRSAGAWEYLDRQGFNRILNMSGGMLAWQGPVEKGQKQ
ncbi:MAG: rhodanese-like domain-containing protein [Mycobacterium leprae]